MNVTINFQAKKTRGGKNLLVFLKLTEQRYSKLISMGIYLSKNANFNSHPLRPYKWISNDVEAARWNERLKDIFLKYDAIKARLQRTNRESIENIIIESQDHGDMVSFMDFINGYIKSLEEDGRRSTLKFANSFKTYLTEYLSKRRKNDISISEITKDFVERFGYYLNKCHNKRIKDGNQLLHPNTIAKIMKMFRTIIILAKNKGLLHEADYPFSGIVLKEKASEKIPLEIEDIRALEQVKLSENNIKGIARNMFLFSFYGCGMRFGDCAQLRWNNITNWQNIGTLERGFRLNYKMNKTGKEVSVILPPQAINILRRYFDPTNEPTQYIFPLLSNKAAFARYMNIEIIPAKINLMRLKVISNKNALINKELKEVAIIAGINSRDKDGKVTINKNVSMHIARHTFAYLSRNAGTSNNVIQEAMGHSDLKETERYMGGMPQPLIDEAVGKMYNQIDSPKDDRAELMELISKMTNEDIKKILETIKKH
jgi:integrase